jgi:hypothetical protein
MKPSDQTRAELEALENLPDSAIDTSNIPERADWVGASRGRFYQPVRRPDRRDASFETSATQAPRDDELS